MTDTPPARRDLTEAEKLAALDLYVKYLKPLGDRLRQVVAAEMKAGNQEKVGAYLPDGTKVASVSRSEGKKSVKVTDPHAALAWCLRNYPTEIIQAVNPAFMQKLLDANKNGEVGSPCVDPMTGEILPWMAIEQGSPYLTVYGTEQGKQRMAELAGGFAGMLEQKPGYDPDFADRLENGGYR